MESTKNISERVGVARRVVIGSKWKLIALRVHIIIFMVVLSSCASNHKHGDGTNPFGGGIYVSDRGEGDFYIVAETNFALTKNVDTAEKMWLNAATKACSGAPFTEEHTRIYSYEHVPGLMFMGISSMITGKAGHAVCVIDTSDK